jgi:hypothetical protein
MKILILKDEYILNNKGHHICDDRGFAIKAEEDIECEVEDSFFSAVQDRIIEERAIRGLDADGNPIPVEEEPQEEPQELEEEGE